MNDEFDGVGGSYELDPETGKRVLKERTQDPADPVPDQNPAEE